MHKRWTLKPLGEPGVVESLAEALNVHRALANLLVQRGITTFDEARLFFRPELDHLHDPWLMQDMDKAVTRIQQAIANGESILVYGDYDVDGTTAVAAVFGYLSQVHNALDFYIPDRYSEGYGVSRQGIDYAAAHGHHLVITLDCGIKAHENVAYAHSLGIDCIVCDHHLPDDTLPEAVAVLDPKRNDCEYPFKELSGCGIGIKLIQALQQQAGAATSALDPFLDLAAISIACDIVPIVGENRVLAHYGLKQLNKAPRQGIKALLDIAQKKRDLTVTDLVFVIGPRINAAGRMEHGKKAVELLLTDNNAAAADQGQNINLNNVLRQDVDLAITQEALEMIKDDADMQGASTTVLFHPEWHKGVIGIVASRLIENYYRPTILFTRSNGMATGSARSVKGFDIHQALEACADLLEQFGGHKYAAGMTIQEANIPAFRKRFEDVVRESINPASLVPEVIIDSELHFAQITPKFFRITRQLGPFGP
ncbi:MAG: single-stranded-DNA-specific exonuclease RecJ, partial [Bacteroidota bacterium]